MGYLTPTIEQGGGQLVASRAFPADGSGELSPPEPLVSVEPELLQVQAAALQAQPARQLLLARTEFG